MLKIFWQNVQFIIQIVGIGAALLQSYLQALLCRSEFVLVELSYDSFRNINLSIKEDATVCCIAFKLV